MKRNFGLSKSFYWSLPREIRREIRSEFDAGMAIYKYLRLYSAREFRRKVRAANYKSITDFVKKHDLPRRNKT